MVDLGAVRVAELETRLNEKIRRFFTRVTRGMGGAIPDKTWSALIDAVKAIRPNLQADIERLLSLQAYSKFRLLGHAAEVLLRERDALGISLDIFSGSNRLRDQVLSQWAPRRNTVRDINETEGTASLGGLPAGSSSFLRGIPQRYLTRVSIPRRASSSRECISLASTCASCSGLPGRRASTAGPKLHLRTPPDTSRFRSSLRVCVPVGLGPGASNLS